MIHESLSFFPLRPLRSLRFVKKVLLTNQIGLLYQPFLSSKDMAGDRSPVGWVEAKKPNILILITNPILNFNPAIRAVTTSNRKVLYVATASPFQLNRPAKSEKLYLHFCLPCDETGFTP